MEYIIGLGGPNDSHSLKMETRKRTFINNVLRKEPPREVMKARTEIMCANYRVRLNSESAAYNCYGMVFAARRTCIVDQSDVEAILQDDGYHRLPWDPSAWRVDDVVIYRNEAGEIQHVGIIAEIHGDIETGNFQTTVLSTWGESGEYLHAIDEVSPLLGRPTEVVSQRFLL